MERTGITPCKSGISYMPQDSDSAVNACRLLSVAAYKQYGTGLQTGLRANTPCKWGQSGNITRYAPDRRMLLAQRRLPVTPQCRRVLRPAKALTEWKAHRQQLLMQFGRSPRR